jgi:hypothetical protein
LKAGRRNMAKQRKQIWNKYKAELTEYNRKKAEREATKSTKRERIKELTKELHTLTNNGKTKEEQKKEVGGSEKQPDEEVPPEPQGEQPPKKSSFQRLGPVESADVNGRQEHYLKQQERGKLELSQHYQEISRRFDKEDDYGESEFKEDRSYYRRARLPDYGRTEPYDRFPCFAGRLQTLKLPHKFKSANHSKYDGKVEPRQWLRVYSQSIELAGGDDDIKALFFPMALEAMPLQWFDKLRPRSIRYWEDLQEAFCNNFAGIITHPMTAAELKGVRQRRGESLREYYRRFEEFRAQVHDITDREVIEASAEGILAN